ncbi:hypothetical protein [Mesomycoplasma lagogenitalium]|uniref:Uncharacterized protein n=1 Tax=Mesomycoplasma lagogenitalium TaxID=171286 RepID=A0ABY8LXV6_9BACT|nr:hypothetical protein [Mesomycoplasma lagogenitalium]WGI36972.1 hypothetical protein QEG99_01660 [Mesomycoplasma lagogenitalium]
MNKTESELKEILNYKYKFEIEYLNKLTYEQLQELYDQKEKEEIALAKNPNKFWYIKSLPVPKEVKTKTSSKAGIWVFVAFCLVLLSVFIIFMVLAFWN